MHSMQRIHHLLDRVRVEISAAIANGEIEPQVIDRFIIPLDGDIGAVYCEFRTYPVGTRSVPPFVEARRYLRLAQTIGGTRQ